MRSAVAKKALIVVALVAVVAALTMSATANPALAASASDFDPGYIVSDEKFFDETSMTAGQIQSFLVQQVPTCETWRTSGPNDPITCLKDYRQTTQTIAADAYCTDTYLGATNELASTIIYKVAQACDVSPQTLLVTLQKEQGLVTHTWPSQYRYAKAMGYGCPDTAPCDTQYFGFQNQVWRAARQFQRYAALPNSYNFRAGYSNIIGYNPNVACGAGSVLIKNQATAGLYNYTPYQPNAAAMSNLYGLGDSCSSYGNRNFWRYWTDWFGSPTAPTSGAMPNVNVGAHIYAKDAQGVLWVYGGDGSGGFVQRARIGSDFGQYDTVIGGGDLDGDGNREILAIRPNGDVSVYSFDGGATWSGPRVVASGWGQYDRVIAVKDFDRDGRDNLMLSDGSGNLFLTRLDTPSTFVTPTRIGKGWNVMTAIFSPGDFDGDGTIDVLARTVSGDLRLYRGDGTGGWKGVVTVGTGWSEMTALFSAGDFDGDGAPDVIARTSSGELLLYRGNGSGGWRGVIPIGVGWNGYALDSAGPLPGLLPGAGTDPEPDTPPAAGVAPILALAPNGQMLAYIGNGNGSWETNGIQLTSSWPTGARAAQTGDFNGNGNADVLAIGGSGIATLYDWSISGGVSGGVQVATGWSDKNAVVNLGDFDGDGMDDLVVRTESGLLQLYRGDGTGNVGTPTRIGSGWAGMNLMAAAGDFDGDGTPDLIARDTAGNLYLYGTTGTGGWRPKGLIGTGWGGFSSIVGVGDFDGDGATDLVARTPSGLLYLYRGNGTGGFQGGVTQIGRGWGDFVWVG